MKKNAPAGGAPADQTRDRPADLPHSLRIFTVREAAGILRVTSSLVRTLVHEGKLRGSRVGVQIRIPASAIEAFLGEAVCRGPDPRRDPGRRAKAAGPPPPWDTATG